MRRKKIVFINGSRSDLGLFISILKTCTLDKRFETYLLRVGHALYEDKDSFSGTKNLKIINVITEKGIKRIKEEIETSLGLSEILKKVSPELKNIKPDIVFVAGDRFEIFACVIAAYYQRIPIAHIFGGDKSAGGHLDDNVRHAITKMSHIHFTVCDDSYKRVLNLGEEKYRVFNFGSPVVDNLKEIEFRRIIKEDYAIVTFHPITGYPEISYKDMKTLLQALSALDMVSFITSPNNEFGSELIMKAIGEFTRKNDKIRYVGNLGWKDYLNYLKYARFSIGNSSSNLLEAPILGTWSIDVGERQSGRFSPKSVIKVKSDKKEILTAINKILKMSNMKFTHPYGKGNVGEKALDKIYSLLEDKKVLQKRITF
jgi:GDP/UDP-N,N'-diacetylbacillosamine 2-epimerase (hydrolysing)